MRPVVPPLDGIRSVFRAAAGLARRVLRPGLQWIAVAALGLILLADLGPLVGLARADKLEWELDETEEGVSLYTAEVADHGYDVVKAVVTLEVPADVLLAHLRDFARYPSWYHACKQARVLERPAETAPFRRDDSGHFLPETVEESYLLLYVQDAEPLDDRWAVVRNRVRVAHGTLTIAFSSVAPQAVHGPPGAVPMRLSGRWELAPLSKTRTRITFVLDVDPNTSTPAFLVDPKIHAIALETLKNLKRITRRPH